MYSGASKLSVNGSGGLKAMRASGRNHRHQTKIADSAKHLLGARARYGMTRIILAEPAPHTVCIFSKI